jgi:hypothetical protein
MLLLAHLTTFDLPSLAVAFGVGFLCGGAALWTLAAGIVKLLGWP